MDKTDLPNANTKSLKALFLLFGFLIVGVAVAAVFAEDLDKSANVNSYEKCAAQKDSRIQESYPSVCITSDNKRFVNPADKHQCGRGKWARSPQACY